MHSLKCAKRLNRAKRSSQFEKLEQLKQKLFGWFEQQTIIFVLEMIEGVDTESKEDVVTN